MSIIVSSYAAEPFKHTILQILLYGSILFLLAISNVLSLLRIFTYVITVVAISYGIFGGLVKNLTCLIRCVSLKNESELRDQGQAKMKCY